MKTTTITNKFTGYSATIRTQGLPAISTLKKHIGKSKAQGCASITCIYIDGVGYDLYHGELIKNGLYADA
jgi:hypothetical protein